MKRMSNFDSSPSKRQDLNALDLPLDYPDYPDHPDYPDYYNDFLPSLPLELVEKICSYLSIIDIAHLVMVYSAFKPVLSHSFFRTRKLTFDDIESFQRFTRKNVFPSSSKSKLYGNVKQVDFSHLPDHAVASLNSIACFSHLTTLDLSYVSIDQTIFANIIENANISSWRKLNLSHCVGINDICVKKLVKHQDFNLDLLNLSNCYNITERGLTILFSFAHSLLYLDVSALWRVHNWSNIIPLVHKLSLHSLVLCNNDAITSNVSRLLMFPSSIRFIDLRGCIDIVTTDIEALQPFYQTVLHSCVLYDHSPVSVARYLSYLVGGTSENDATDGRITVQSL
jgi:hypothetical protein